MSPESGLSSPELFGVVCMTVPMGAAFEFHCAYNVVDDEKG